MNTFLAKKYFQYALRAKDEHSIHSPFVFDLYCNAIKSEDQYYAFDQLKKIRWGLEMDNSVLDIEDFGAGSKFFPGNKRTVKDIIAHGVTAEKYSKLLFRLVEYFNSQTIVEMGTSIGINTLYLASSSKKRNVFTLEGSKALCTYAKNLFKKNDFKNINVIEGNFDVTFSGIVNKIDRLDFLFIDGNHRKTPTLRYFETALGKVHNDSVIVLDDIYWSEEMTDAWKEIKSHPRVTVTVDLFRFGIVFFRKEHKEKEHFVLRY